MGVGGHTSPSWPAAPGLACSIGACRCGHRAATCPCAVPPRRATAPPPALPSRLPQEANVARKQAELKRKAHAAAEAEAAKRGGKRQKGWWEERPEGGGEGGGAEEDDDVEWYRQEVRFCNLFCVYMVLLWFCF